VFYISEKVTEDSDQIPEKHAKLKGDSSRLKKSKRKMKLYYYPPYYNVKKPYHELKYCLYGSFAQGYITE